MNGRRLRIAFFIFILLISTSCARLYPSGLQQRSSNDEVKVTGNETIKERYEIITYEREISGSGSKQGPEPFVPEMLIRKKDTQKSCDKFVLPTKRKLPDIPVVGGLIGGNPEEMGEVLIDHIRDIRDFYRDRESEIQERYQAYLKSCQ